MSAHCRRKLERDGTDTGINHTRRSSSDGRTQRDVPNGSLSAHIATTKEGYQCTAPGARQWTGHVEEAWPSSTHGLLPARGRSPTSRESAGYGGVPPTYQSTYCVGPYDARLYRTWYIPTDISVRIPRRYLYCTHTNDEFTEYAALGIQAHTNVQPNCRRYAVSD